VNPFQLHVATWRQTSQTHKPKKFKVAKNILLYGKNTYCLLGLRRFVNLKLFFLIKSFTTLKVHENKKLSEISDWIVYKLNHRFHSINSTNSVEKFKHT